MRTVNKTLTDNFADLVKANEHLARANGHGKVIQVEDGSGFKWQLSFDLIEAEKLRDLQDGWSEEYVVKCFNQGHDLETRRVLRQGTKLSQKVDKAAKRNTTQAEILSDPTTEQFRMLVTLMQAAVNVSGINALTDWLDKQAE